MVIITHVGIDGRLACWMGVDNPMKYKLYGIHCSTLLYMKLEEFFRGFMHITIAITHKVCQNLTHIYVVLQSLSLCGLGAFRKVQSSRIAQAIQQCFSFTFVKISLTPVL